MMYLLAKTCLIAVFSIGIVSFSSILQANVLRIATYNIWNPVFEEKYAGANTWTQRLPFIVENILASESDLIGLEEVKETTYHDLQRHPAIAQRYKSFYFSHAPSELGQKEGRDGLAFFYRPDKFFIVTTVQSKDTNRPTHRRDYYVDLKTKSSSKREISLRFASTHLDADKNLAVGNSQLQALVNDVTQANSLQNLDLIVVCGDFNEGDAEKDRPRYTIMRQAGFVEDGSKLPTRADGLKVRHSGHIDWIYFKKLSPLDFKLIPVKPIGDERASDHKISITDVEFLHMP